MDEVSGTQRAILGAETAGQVRDWLDRHLREHLGSGVEDVLFTGGDVGAVVGLRLTDGRDVVLKALRPGADDRRLQTVVRAQNMIAASGFGCARVLDGPSRTDGVLAIVEERLTGQIDILRGVDGT